MKSGLHPILPDRKDYSLIPTFGSLALQMDGLPTSFSIYDGRTIANQNLPDTRFLPAGRPLPMGCVAETLTLEAGIKNKTVYPPDDFYMAIPPGIDGEGRDIRKGLQASIDRGFKRQDGTFDKELAYFNCYGSGRIDDFDAARFALWINQDEKRGVEIGSWWYSEFNDAPLGYLPLPSFNTRQASLHCWLGTGFESTYKDDYLEGISHQGMEYGDKGKHYVSREMYNAMMAQPYTGAFTITNTRGLSPVPVGVQAEIDHLLYYVRNLFRV